eukprot:TRINITY_DN5024_c0_g1_i5.p1 TRINITY_DN5024_c0_g1~~TRINITY_DN5024_c0_g1_i5.p1  ORF type:complete len:288 (-),score=29.59 TRINITY_DN5024_c0_g1_i5:61-924(-)
MSNQKVPAGIDLRFTSWSATRNEGYRDPSVSLPPTQPISNLGNSGNQQQYKKGRPGGGWDEDESEQVQQTVSKTTTQQQFPKSIQTGPSISAAVQQNNQIQKQQQKITDAKQEIEILSPEDLQNKNCEYETKLVYDIVQPGGARIKQPDQLLDQFCKACETLLSSVIGSLLLHKLYSEVPWIVKAKSLYAIEALVRKSVKFQKYFQANKNTVENFPIEQDGNAEQLTNIQSTVLKVIDDPSYVEMSTSTGPTFKMGNVNKLIFEQLVTGNKPSQGVSKSQDLSLIHI